MPPQRRRRLLLRRRRRLLRSMRPRRRRRLLLRRRRHLPRSMRPRRRRRLLLRRRPQRLLRRQRLRRRRSPQRRSPPRRRPVTPEPGLLCALRAFGSAPEWPVPLGGCRPFRFWIFGFVSGLVVSFRRRQPSVLTGCSLILRAFFRALLRSGHRGQMEIFTGVERRRRWRVGDKLRILAELDEPGVRFNDAARRHDLSRGLLWQWRDAHLCGQLVEDAPVFLPVRVAMDVPCPAPATVPALTDLVPAGADGTRSDRSRVA